MAEGALGAVVLAAGASRRFGDDNKLLAHINGRTLIERVIDALEGAGIGPIVVVTGWDREGVTRALEGRGVHLVHNPDWDAGMGGSIAAGISALDTAIAGAFIVPGDMPLLTPRAVGQLAAAFNDAGADRIVYPATAGGEQRNPVLWPQRFFAALMSLPPAEGAKSLLAARSADAVPVVFACTAALQDVDTREELQSLSPETRAQPISRR